METDSSNTSLAQLNRYFLENSLWPAVAYTTLLMLVGTVGNILVIIVYRRHFRRSVTRMFIYTLAVLDLGNCLITMPAELMILIEFTNFPSAAWCKLSRYLTYTFNGTSSIILITIALDRYFKVCRPTKICITIRRGRIICLAAFLFAALCSVPALVLYGDMHLPILVSQDGLSILPSTGDVTNTSTFPSDGAYTGVKVLSARGHLENKLETKFNSLSSDSSAYLVYGTFCLLNSHHIDSALPLLFYVSMFLMYLVLVVLVVFFYSQVARTMFVMTRKRSRMFTFYGYNNSSPVSNSLVAPEEGKVFFNRADSKVVIENSVIGANSSADNAPIRSDAPQGGSSGDAKNVGKSKSIRDQGALLPLPRQTTGETGYGTDDTKSDGDASAGEGCHHQVGQVDSSCRLANKVTVRSGMSESCADIGTCVTQTADDDSTMASSPKSKSLGDLLVNPKSSPSTSSMSGLSPKSGSGSKKGSKKKGSQKIPKIKVEEASSKGSNPNLIVQCVQTESSAPGLTAVSTNSLLLRRIKSAENIHSLTRLHKLQVPGTGGRQRPYLPDKFEVTCKQVRNKSKRRDVAAGIGNISKSCINLDFVDKAPDVEDPFYIQEKTMTLTKSKTSPKGKKKLCTLPLTGLSTKMAEQVRGVHKDTNNDNNAESRSGLRKPRDGIDLVKEEQISLLTKNGTPNVSVSNLESEVTLRTSSLHVRGDKLSDDGRSPEGKKMTPRQEIISSADILQENHMRGSLHPVRTSRMLFVISLVFVISFLPFFVIVLVRSSQGASFLTSLNDAELAVVNVCIRSSLISNAVNPIVYGLLSTHFRRECTGVVCCMCAH